MKTFLCVVAVLLATSLFSQSLGTTLVSSGGGSAPAGTSLVNWSIGEPVIGTGTIGANSLTQGFQQSITVRIRLSLGIFLEGPFNAGTSLMGDGLRSGGWLPLAEPYTGLGYTHVGGGGEVTTAPVLAVTGNNAIVDWIFVELRDGVSNTTVQATRSALLQRDGDIVDVDGVSPIRFAAPPGPYFIGVRHRNHLAAATLLNTTLGTSPVTVNLRNSSTPMYGDALKSIGADTKVMWAGDTRGNGNLKYTGATNDRDPILVKVGSATPNNAVNGYWREDVNMDAAVKYTGTGNDRDPILLNVGSTTPNNVRTQPLP